MSFAKSSNCGSWAKSGEQQASVQIKITEVRMKSFTDGFTVQTPLGPVSTIQRAVLNGLAQMFWGDGVGGFEVSYGSRDLQSIRKVISKVCRTATGFPSGFSDGR